MSKWRIAGLLSAIAIFAVVCLPQSAGAAHGVARPLSDLKQVIVA